MTTAHTGYAAINGAQLYYELAGQGRPLVLVHAGVADSGMWDGQFEAFAKHYLTIRYDMRGYGKSVPVPGEYTFRDDLYALLQFLKVEQAYLVGCSMGGGTCMDVALEHPEMAAALVMVGSGPGGLEIDVPLLDIFAEMEAADAAKDWDRLTELETQLWFDGEGRTPDQVDADARARLWKMNWQAVEYAAQELGTRKAPLQPTATERLPDLAIPVLIIYGDRDTAYIQQSASYMDKHLSNARKVLMPNTAHLPNMERPAEFNQIVLDFLQKLP